MKVSELSRKEYLERIRGRYGRAGREHKGRILNEFCEVCGYDRKHAIKLLNGSLPSPKGRRGCRPRYGEAEREILEEIWRHAEQLCSKRLKAALPLWLPAYERRHGVLGAKVRANLLAMSPATMDRLLAPLRAREGRSRRSGTRPGSLLKTQIPIRTGAWDVSQPGYLEADTVAHCGGSMSGEFVWSLTFTDIHTGWSGCRAVWNRGAQGVVEEVRNIEESLPFRILGFDSDNGSEFLNHHLLRYFTDRPRKRRIHFTRSRPYQKNDNAYVEQKNWTHVRQLLGYERLEDPALLEPINDLYRQEWLQLQNFFCPSMKLLSKERHGSRYVKRYDTPQTPYQRLKKGKGLSRAKRRELKELFEQLDPFELQQCIEKKLKTIFAIAKRLPERRAS